MGLGRGRGTLHLEGTIMRQDGNDLLAVRADVMVIVGPLGEVGDEGADDPAEDTTQDGRDAVGIVSEGISVQRDKRTPFGRSFPGRRG